MTRLTCQNTEVCVIGRVHFGSGIANVSFAACELLSRYFPVSIYPTDDGANEGALISLPNSRFVPVSRDLARHKVFFYTDVLWNGEGDLNYTIVPQHGLRIAHIAYDSDEFPARWVQILNQSFDVALFSSRHLEIQARRNGVKIAAATLPIGLDIEHLLVRPFKPVGKKVVFGSVAAFHPRKGADILVNAFMEEFGDAVDVELVIHSNLAFGSVYEKLSAQIEAAKVSNVVLSNSNLDDQRKTELIESFDIFVNCSRGEGYSIGPREALALGKAVVLSDIDAHKEMLDLPGSWAIPALMAFPARYPEINNQIFGRQAVVTVSDTRKALRAAYDTVRNATPTDVRTRRKRAAEFSFGRLAFNYAQILTPDIARFKKCAPSSGFFYLNDACTEIARQKLGQYSGKLKVINRTILPAHDGGFFSVFNAFISHLVWDLREDRCHMVLPDWDVGRLLERQGDKKLISFCYGKPQDGNIWTKLFEPLYGLTENQMNDRAFLYDKAEMPETIWNEHREPLLTYVHAYDLYISPSFKAFRRQYHQAFKQHVKLRPEMQAEITDFYDRHFEGKYMLAAHVKHPSHMIEQPGLCIAHGQAFIDLIKNKVAEEQLNEKGVDWGVFLATDQDRVVAQFREVFGDRVYFFEDVRRTRIAEDDLYEQLSESDKAKEGYQVQHLVAASPDQWTTRMAWEVIRDAMLMARSRVLFHVVSNVSTAVSYMNPDVELVFVK